MRSGFFPSNDGELSLGELRRTTSLFEAVLLSFLCAGVSREEAFLFKCGTAVGLRFEERTSHAQTDSTRLTGISAADDVDEYVVFVLRL